MQHKKLMLFLLGFDLGIPLVLNSLYLTGESPNLSLYFVPKISSSK
tara:strand:- start:539 stop:676 length:138 start_codon:yes stop_codon:yes gene_type:complete